MDGDICSSERCEWTFLFTWDLRGFKADLMDVNGFIADLMDVNECQRTIYGILMVLNGDLMEI